MCESCHFSLICYAENSTRLLIGLRPGCDVFYYLPVLSDEMTNDETLVEEQGGDEIRIC